jgi:hypothetical protein
MSEPIKSWSISEILTIVVIMFILVILVAGQLGMLGAFSAPGVIVDSVVTPNSHWWGVVKMLPSGPGTYCLHAETTTRHSSATIAMSFRNYTGSTTDRFGTEEHYVTEGFREQIDDVRILDRNFTIPAGAVDRYVSVQTMYDDTGTKVHLIVKRC